MCVCVCEYERKKEGMIRKNAIKDKNRYHIVTFL